MSELRSFIGSIHAILHDPSHVYESEVRAAVQAAFDASRYQSFADKFYSVFFHHYFKEDLSQLEAFDLALRANDLDGESENERAPRAMGAAALFLKENLEDLHEEIGRVLLLNFAESDDEAGGEPKLIPSWWANRGLASRY